MRQPLLPPQALIGTYKLLQDVFCLGGVSNTYTVRSRSIWEAGEKVSLTQFGRAMGQLGEMIPACSPEARGRLERVFSTHQGRLVTELALAGITDMEEANRYLAETCLPAYNAELTQPPPEAGSAFVACQDLSVLDDILCERFERGVRKDNCVHVEGRVLQIPADRQRCHYVKVKVLRYTDNSLAFHHGPQELA